jgi:hypothetical protein
MNADTFNRILPARLMWVINPPTEPAKAMRESVSSNRRVACFRGTAWKEGYHE